MRQVTVISAPAGPAAGLARLEATAAVFSAIVIGLMFALLGGYAAVSAHEKHGWNWMVSCGVAVLGGEVVTIAWLKRGLDGPAERSTVPGLALRQPRWPVASRPVLAGWWLAHGAVAAGAMWLLEQAVQWEGRAPVASAVLLTLVLFGYFTISHTMHLFVMLTISAVLPSSRWVYAWWRWRFLIDLLVTAGALIATLRN